MPKKLIVGLGNPGQKYRHTRHNVGFMLVDLLSKALSIPLNHEKNQSHYGQGQVDGQTVWLVQPQTFMNASGDSVSLWVRKEGLDAATDLLVICDEMQLALGRLRLRPEGSAGSHNGLASIIEGLGGQKFARLRIGVDKPAHPGQWADYVLEPFQATEKEALKPVLEKGLEACRLWLAEPSFEKVMSKVNG